MWTAEELFPCLHPIERDQVIGVVTNFVGGTFVLTDLQYTLISLSSGIEYNSSRFHAFNGVYDVQRIETGLPPPLDVIWEFDSVMWSMFYDFYFDVVVPGNEPPCDIFAFKGNQGGAWPVLWPT